MCVYMTCIVGKLVEVRWCCNLFLHASTISATFNTHTHVCKYLQALNKLININITSFYRNIFTTYKYSASTTMFTITKTSSYIISSPCVYIPWHHLKLATTHHLTHASPHSPHHLTTLHAPPGKATVSAGTPRHTASH